MLARASNMWLTFAFWRFRKSSLEGSPNCPSTHVSSFTPSSEANGYRKVSLDGSPVPPIVFLCIHVSPSCMPFSEANGCVRAGSLEDSQLFFSSYLYIDIRYICLPLSYHLPRQMAGA